MTTSDTELARRALDFSLASTLASYPDAEVEATLRELEPALREHPAGHWFTPPADWDELRAAYVGQFDRGEGRVSLHGTEYGRMRGMSKGTELAELAGFYRAFGVRLDSAGTHELQDHLAVELEFYALLLQKQRYQDEAQNAEGAEIVADARRRFLHEYLGPLAKAAAARLEGSQGPYADVVGWAGALVRDECAAVGVTPIPLDFFEDPDAKEEVRCGDAVHLPVVS